ncbi:hypothetical protein Rsub_09507 [Raphidocelis subcapitata]|uniref:Uncharacterized protein n=1 Tax=Raphidocelis subcapitata TaxID=307507 RepID=A0A2V0PAZ5_9CHLO|nr:hypothetical protein Rsub_09507 [Raphidocelis subcapitata]|eukprot:GBF97034.1 hypothetical protein Rsub_09507 [Raphidocelis subcapitata]
MEGLEQRGCRLLALDVTKPVTIHAAVEKVLEDAGRIDVVVNNAGVAVRKPAIDTSLEEVRSMFDVNYFGVVAVNDAVMPHMIERRSGKIVNIGSGLGYTGLPTMSHYSAVKHAVRSYSDMLRIELCPFGIQVCFVAPGYIQTHIGERYELPRGSLYHAFPRLERELARTIFIGTTYEAATPADKFAARLAAAVLAKRIPRHYRDGHMAIIPWLASMFVPLWVYEWGFGLRYGLLPNCQTRRPFGADEKGGR